MLRSFQQICRCHRKWVSLWPDYSDLTLKIKYRFFPLAALLDLNPKMEILRIYGQSKENKCYPLPCLTSFVKEKVQLQDEKTDERLRDYTLHHLIRNEKKCVYAKTILELEGALTMGPNFMNQVNNDDNGNVDKSFEGMLTRYKNLKKNAEKFFIERAKVIVITCTGIGAGKLKDYCIKQVAFSINSVFAWNIL